MKRSVFNPTVIFSIFILLLSWGCKRNLSPEAEVKPVPKQISTGTKTNPFSLRNIIRAQDTIAARSGTSARMAVQAVSSYPTYVYFKLNPANFSSGQFKYLEGDTTCMLLDFPFGDGAVYDNEGIDAAAIEALKDGFLYGMAPIEDTVLTKLQAMSNLGFTRLDTIVLPPDSSTTLQQVALQQAGFDARLLGFCPGKKPRGYVRYMDNMLGREEPVRGMKVWAISFGIPVSAYTDANGFYQINRSFVLGSIMGTEARNSRVNVRPIATQGTWLGNWLRILTQFVTGSNNIYGWVSACDMGSGKDFVFRDHSQQKFWGQILNAYYFSDIYFKQEGINPAPDKMVVYAHWDNTDSDFGNASTPMLGHINFAGVFVESYLNKLFGANVNLSTSAPGLFNVLTSALPDMTIKVSATHTPSYYETRLTQTVFHELGHASFSRQVSNTWYTEMMLITMNLTEATGNPYGKGDYEVGTNYIGMSESWAEFIGHNFALRRYPSGSTRRTNTEKGSGFALMSDLIESEEYFFAYKWMPYGMYHDLMDGFNPLADEAFDVASGTTIKQMYNAFQPNINSWCPYFNLFTKNNAIPGAWSVFQHYVSPWNCGTLYGNQAINQSYTKNDCQGPGVGSVVQVQVAKDKFFSPVSVPDANLQAQKYAQLLANQNGTCLCTNCTGNNKKCINGVCETGVKEYYKSEPLRDGTNACYFQWRFSDGTTQTGGIDRKSTPCID
ncbi:DUF5977 domain-containing protein [Chitinophaga pinensis]|uniref:DUF5977 domain-containing protein n=1 Tax=Chitinophaga pinensis TaxID=79329 RepID=A0A5C6LY96_9BACT|nr:DUF5977 domain-containing protein [Chitinophaga pinensis]TWW01764.1 hypothetical protein FEF09_04170 [Chitinophaga pinensis]